MSLYSTYWYRVADIKPSLRRHVVLHRHVYRNENWYVLQDPSSGRQHRFNTNAYLVISLMDGQRTVAAIWDAASALLGDQVPSQDEIIRLLSQLHSIDVLQSSVPPDTQELFQRQSMQRGKWKQRFKNPFALRFPLLDPDRFLVKWMPLVRPLFSWSGLLIWFLFVGTAVVLAALHWPELSQNMADRVFTPENLLLLWCVYPAVKLLHELGHAFATRIWGGEVHEMGLMLLAFTPIPYVEASSSAAFPDKRRRMAVAAAGMAVELFVAAAALFIWLNVESGQVSTIAYNIMLVGGISTLLFNGNPLLRYDGYYILADWIEIPNLGQRSTRYLGYLLQRYLFGVTDAASPVTSKGEPLWFVAYGIISFCYRLLVLALLALFISSKFFFVGVLIALWAICTQIIVPAIRNSYSFFQSVAGRRKRTRFVTASLLSAVLTLIMLFVVPAPLRTRAEGVVSLPEHSRVRAGTDCFIADLLAEDGQAVAVGDPLIRCVDPYIEAEARVLKANVEEVRAQYNAEPLQSRVQREILKDKKNAAQADLTRTLERMNELTIRSPGQGLLVLPDAKNLAGRFVKQGDLLGYIVGAGRSSVLVVVRQDDIALVRERTRGVELRLAGSLDTLLTTTVNREIPAASEYLPSPVLGTGGGGKIAVAPGDPQGTQTLRKTFQLEFNYPFKMGQVRIGERVYALFDHGYEPLGLQWYRCLRQLFLRQFHV
ncbi:efflux RND transporter periplasmic adaptor subunit [Desulfogranum mediterraneum]|uniref:hypothetical protein n=1 Tax=Desulfogranum mediterraneum TaxID=160661 RepID=UPI0004043C4C|nr:hypothetical protein [Desulfogranum mediterraneum]